MQFLHLHRCPHSAARVEAAFASNLRAQERVGQAADDVAEAADAQRLSVEAVHRRILAKSRDDRRRRPEPPTSSTRALVEEALRTLDRKSEDGRC